MNLTVTRDPQSKSTPGLLDISGLFQCFTLELPKFFEGKENVPDKTCIPCGTYPVEIRYSEKHQCDKPWITEVPEREDIEIDVANDTGELLGCTAVGQYRMKNVKVGNTVWPDWVGGSQLAFDALMAKLKTAENGITITFQENNPFQVTDPELGT